MLSYPIIRVVVLNATLERGIIIAVHAYNLHFYLSPYPNVRGFLPIAQWLDPNRKDGT